VGEYVLQAKRVQEAWWQSRSIYDGSCTGIQKNKTRPLNLTATKAKNKRNKKGKKIT